jgi:hypothetical protein
MIALLVVDGLNMPGAVTQNNYLRGNRIADFFC